MPLHKFGFIVTASGLNPETHRMEMKTDNFTMIAIGISHPKEGPEAAVKLKEEGIQLLELCGGFAPKWTAKITEALENSIPVGSVSYGPEAIDGMHALFQK